MVANGNYVSDSGDRRSADADVNNGVADLLAPERTRNFPPEEGCVVLGLDGPKEKQYVTRYCIDHKMQREKLCCEVLQEEWAPCCGEEGRKTCGQAVWSAVSNETVLFTLHMGTIFLGVFKVAHPDVSESDHLELVHSIIEMLVTSVLVIVRTALGWVDYQEVKETVYRYEHVVDKRFAKGRHIKMWLVMYTLTSALLLALVVVTFAVFHMLDHLAWTILVNQFTLVAILSTSGLFFSRINVTMKKIREDQNRAVIHEALLLIKEGHAATSSDEKRNFRQRAAAFDAALDRHETFGRPRHLDVHSDHKNSVLALDKVQFSM